MSAARRTLALGLALACAAPAAAQLPFATPTSGLTVEAGLFSYAQRRFPGDRELRVAAALGWRRSLLPWYVESQLGVLTRVDGAQADAAPCSASACEGSTQEAPVFWPGIGAGVMMEVPGYSHTLGARLALGIRDDLEPRAALRYEAAARRIALYLEASVERAPWTSSESDPATGATLRSESGTAWLGGFTVGGRLWLRDLTTPVPHLVPDPDLRAPDAGILPPNPKPAKN